MKYFGIILLLALISFSCTKDLNVPLPVHEPKITLYSFLSEGDPIDIYITRSFGLLEKVGIQDISIKDAKVELYRNDVLIDEMMFLDTLIADTLGYFTYSLGPGRPDTTIYTINTFGGAQYVPSKELIPPVAGDRFKFVVSHPTYGTVQAETQIPQKALLSDVRVVPDTLTFTDVEGYTMTWSALDVKINDPIGLGDHYNLLIAKETEVDLDTIQYIHNREWSYPGPEIARDPDGYTYIENHAISDEGNDGQKFSSLWWFTLRDYWQGSGPPPYTQIRIRALSLTETYAKFQRKLRDQVYNRLSGVESAFVPSEPVVVPSNVEGGYGVVGAYNVSEDYIVLMP